VRSIAFPTWKNHYGSFVSGALLDDKQLEDAVQMVKAAIRERDAETPGAADRHPAASEPSLEAKPSRELRKRTKSTPEDAESLKPLPNLEAKKKRAKQKAGQKKKKKATAEEPAPPLQPQPEAHQLTPAPTMPDANMLAHSSLHEVTIQEIIGIRPDDFQVLAATCCLQCFSRHQQQQMCYCQENALIAADAQIKRKS